ncbi:helix-turn-helix domain-containing protein [Flavobacterium sp. F-328]|uniref:Helix-turn-helix domain-containing protein n=1 Tax=Flavobacterium erciyesense TaxID=2825842 RepID=A0ABS5D4D5_9FLAO|nr:helix-turn-helix domain-containing protein [Flavobacterium erciyesense]MBQ0908872.1 helix-turn-helix domain-containing protein [Flavobacterium erciyesense]
MHQMLKLARVQKGLKTREVAQLLGIDQALISKFETGNRKPTKDQLVKLAHLLEIDIEKIVILWLKDKILNEINNEEWAMQALQLAQQELQVITKPKKFEPSKILLRLLDEVASLKNDLSTISHFDRYRISKALEIELTHESNRAAGNSMSLEETDLIINKGHTISGKSMREHLEVINQHEALAYLRDLAQNNTVISSKELHTLYQLLIRGISSDAIENQTNESNKELESFFTWFESQKNELHPMIFAVQTYQKLRRLSVFDVEIEKMACLVTNYLFLLNGYTLLPIIQTLLNTTNSSEEENYIAVINEQKNILKRYGLTTSIE